VAIVVRIWPRPRRSLKLKMNDGVMKADTSPAAVTTDPLPNIDRKTGVPVSLKVFDLAGSQSECVSYHPGHAVHWIQYFKSVDAPLVIPVTADVADDGFVRIQWDDSSLEHWNHDPVALGSALRRARGRAVWKPRWHVLVVPTGQVPGAGNVFNLAAPDQRTPRLRTYQ
jgi:hypothetical protein